MPRFYKFLPKDFRDAVAVQGCLRFSSLEYYRHLEAITGDSQIGDIKERRSASRFPDVTIRGGVTDASPEDLAIHGFRAAEDVGIRDLVMSNNWRVQTAGPAVAFCFAIGPYESVAPVFANPTATHAGYGAALEFDSAEALAELIWTTGRVPEMDGRPVADIFHDIKHGCVTYDWQETRLGYDAPIPADGFHKRSIYSEQREYRILLLTKDKNIPDQLTIAIDHATDIFSPLVTGVAEADVAKRPQPSLPDLAQEIVAWMFSNPRPPDPTWMGMRPRRVTAPQLSQDELYAAFQTRGEAERLWRELFNRRFGTSLLEVVWMARLRRIDTNLDNHYSIDLLDRDYWGSLVPDRILDELTRLNSLFAQAG